MESINLDSGLSGAGYAQYSIIPYLPTFIRLSHLYQEYHIHYGAIANAVGMGCQDWLIYVRMRLVG